MRVNRLRWESEAFQRTLEKELRRTLHALLEELLVRQAERRTMEEEWTSAISGGRLVTFTHLLLPEGVILMTAQIAGHDVVYSIIAQEAQPFTREGVERRFDYECPPITH